MIEIMTINQLANICGYYEDAFIEKGVTVNNGYNCTHPEQTEVYDGIGCCYAWSCPLAIEADEQDCEEYGVEYQCDDAYVLVDLESEVKNDDD